MSRVLIGRVRFTLASALTLGALASCASDSDGVEGEREFDFSTGPLMMPGEDCTFCHRPDSDYETAPHWSVAGTVYPSAQAGLGDGIAGVRVIMMDAAGGEILTLTTNSAGNFYSAVALPDLYRVSLEYEGERIEMPCPPPSGGCAKCHRRPPNGSAPGRLFIPQGQGSPQTFDCETWTSVAASP